MIGAVLRGVRGIEVDDETLAVDAIESVVKGEGHYLGHPQTLARMKSDYLYPEVADRQPPRDWEQAGALDMRERGRRIAREILQNHFPDYVDNDTDRWIRERYEIRLPRQAMERI